MRHPTQSPAAIKASLAWLAAITQSNEPFIQIVPKEEKNMGLRGTKPTAKTKRLKLLLYGPAGSGKTTAAIRFPKPYLIDTERGAENEQYVDLLNKQGGLYLFTTDSRELISEVKALISTPHQYKTLIIDPLTVIYNDLLDKGMEEKGEEFGRYKIPADRAIKQLLALLLRLDMNVIITSHAKPKWVRSKDAAGKDTAVQEGNTFDCYGRLDYLFDLVIEVGQRGKERVGHVRKTRILGFPEGDVFPFSYDEIATRYGREVLERDAKVEELATPLLVAEFLECLKIRTDADAIVAKLLKQYDAADLTEVPAERVKAGIAAFTPTVAAKPEVVATTNGKKSKKTEKEEETADVEV